MRAGRAQPVVVFYSRPVGENSENLALMRLIDEQFLEAPWYGARQMARHLRRQGHVVGRKRVRRLMATMGLAAVYQRPRTTAPQPGHRIWPYLLRDSAIDRPDQVWCADITYIPMRRGFLYLVAVMDWVSRQRSWLGGCRTRWTRSSASTRSRRRWRGTGGRRSSTPTRAEGSQFTSPRFTGVLTGAGVRVSMDGRGRWMDNVFIERLSGGR